MTRKVPVNHALASVATHLRHGLSWLLLAILFPAAGQTAEPDKTDFDWRKTDTSITLLNHGKMVWQHVHDRKIGKPFMRFGLLDGTELTRPCPFPKDYPKNDHTWHRALWWSFKAIDGVNYWEENQPGTDPVQVDVETRADGSAVIRATVTYHLPDQPPVVIEKRTIRVGAPDASGTYRIDWQATFTAAGKKDVVFNRNGYGGFAIRMAAECCGDAESNKPAWTFFNSEDLPGINGRNARWVGYRGTAQNGRPACIAMFDHPDNPRHPTPWQTRGQYPYMNPSFTCKEDYTLQAGKSLTLRYGVLVHDGSADGAVIEKRYREFAETAADLVPRK